MSKIKVLIVDDSVLFRSQIQLALKDCPEVEVVGTAANGKIAVEKLALQEVDLITLDVEMPVMDGLETIQAIRARGLKTKIIMFSSLTSAGAEKTLKAVSLGATDFVQKPNSANSSVTPADKIKELLVPKILGIFGKSGAAIVSSVGKKVTHNFVWDLFNPQVLVIASSTGGPGALMEFFKNLKAPVPFPILIAQHMPPVFTQSLAKTLGEISGKVAKEAVHGEILKNDHIYIAPGDFHFKVGGDKKNPVAMLDQGPQRNFVRPCANYLFESAVQVWGHQTMGIVFTGMGSDGAEGAKAIKDNHGAVLIQNEESCVVFGMPGAVYENKDFDFQGNPEDIARKVLLTIKSRIGHVA